MKFDPLPLAWTGQCARVMKVYSPSSCSPPFSSTETSRATSTWVGVLAEYVPYTPLTAQNLKKLADLKPKTLAIMHGSSFMGDCARALDDLNVAFREVFGRQK